MTHVVERCIVIGKHCAVLCHATHLSQCLLLHHETLSLHLRKLCLSLHLHFLLQQRILYERVGHHLLGLQLLRLHLLLRHRALPMHRDACVGP